MATGLKLCQGCQMMKSTDMFSPKQGKCKECCSKKAKTGYVSQAKPKEIKPVKTSKIICECGGRDTYSNKATHMKTAKHMDTMNALNKSFTELRTQLPSTSDDDNADENRHNDSYTESKIYMLLHSESESFYI